MYKKLSSLKINKAHGDDGIASVVLKEISSEIKQALKIIYIRLMSESKVLDDWKTANVIPIFKKGNKGEESNYRPVSLISHVCKILESIVKDSIVNYINENDLLNETKHGFVSKRSCLTNLLQFIEKVTDYI